MKTSKHSASRWALGCALALSAAFMPAVAAPVLMVVPGASAAEVGSSLSVDIRIEDVMDLYAFNFTLSYDATTLRLLSIDEGAFLPAAGATFFIPGMIDNIAGLASFTGYSLLGAIPGANGRGVLATFSFLGIGVGTSALSLSDTQALDSAFADIAFTTQNAQILITPAIGVPEPTALALVSVALLGCLGASGAQRRGMVKRGSGALLRLSRAR